MTLTFYHRKAEDATAFMALLIYIREDRGRLSNLRQFKGRQGEIKQYKKDHLSLNNPRY